MQCRIGLFFHFSHWLESYNFIARRYFLQIYQPCPPAAEATANTELSTMKMMRIRTQFTASWFHWRCSPNIAQLCWFREPKGVAHGKGEHPMEYTEQNQNRSEVLDSSGSLKEIACLFLRWDVRSATESRKLLHPESRRSWEGRRNWEGLGS